MHAAAYHGHLEVFCMLYKRGGNPNIVNFHGRSALREMEIHKPDTFVKLQHWKKEQKDLNTRYNSSMSAAKREWLEEKQNLEQQLAEAHATIAQLKKELELKDLSLNNKWKSPKKLRNKKKTAFGARPHSWEEDEDEAE